MVKDKIHKLTRALIVSWHKGIPGRLWSFFDGPLTEDMANEIKSELELPSGWQWGKFLPKKGILTVVRTKERCSC